MVMMFLAIVIDVLLRNLGLQSSAHLFTFTEYALLMTPCFGAPWLVREKGHVFVEIGLNALSGVWRQRHLDTTMCSRYRVNAPREGSHDNRN